MPKRTSFCYFNTSPEITYLTVMLHKSGSLYRCASSKRCWQRHLDEVDVKVRGVTHCLWRVSITNKRCSLVAKSRDRTVALRFLKKAMKRHGRPEMIATDRLRSCGAALKDMGRGDDREMGLWLNNRAENSRLPFRPRMKAMLRFRRVRTLQKAASVHASVHKHIPTKRHLQNRVTKKQARAAALVEWRGPLAA